MKKGPIIALVVLVALTALYFVLKPESKTSVASPMAVEAVVNPTRVEVVKPSGDSKLVVLEKREGVWAMTKPVNAPMDERIAKQLDEALGKSIKADDLAVSEAKFKEYELSDESAYRVAIYADSASTPNAEFQLGRDVRVPGTNAKRAYIKTKDGKAFRAHTELGAVLRQDVSKLRRSIILDGERSDVTEMTIEPKNGTKFKISKGGTKWELASPKETKMELELANVEDLVASLTHLKAVGFEDDRDLKKTGLDKPIATISWRTADSDELRRLTVGPAVEGKYYVEIPGQPTIYEITKTKWKTFKRSLLDYRKRTEKELPAESFQEIKFAGDDKVVIQKQGESWVMTKPQKGAVDDAKLAPRIGTFTNLRANTFHDISTEEAGLSKPFATLHIKTESGPATLLIGKEIDSRGTRYAKWSDSQYVMSVTKFVTDRATAKVSDLIKEGT